MSATSKFFPLFRPAVLLVSSGAFFGINYILAEFLIDSGGVDISLILMQIQYFVGLLSLILYNVFKIEFLEMGRNIFVGPVILAILIFSAIISPYLAFGAIFFLRIAISRTHNTVCLTWNYIFLFLGLLAVFALFLRYEYILFSSAFDFVLLVSFLVLLLFLSIGYTKFWIPSYSWRVMSKSISFKSLKVIFQRSFLEIVLAIIPFTLITYVSLVFQVQQSAIVIKTFSILGVTGLIVFVIESYIFSQKDISCLRKKQLFVSSSAGFGLTFSLCIFIANFEPFLAIISAVLGAINVFVGFFLSMHKTKLSSGKQIKLARVIIIIFSIYFSLVVFMKVSTANHFIAYLMLYSLMFMAILYLVLIRSKVKLYA